MGCICSSKGVVEETQQLHHHKRSISTTQRDEANEYVRGLREIGVLSTWNTATPDLKKGGHFWSHCHCHGSHHPSSWSALIRIEESLRFLKLYKITPKDGKADEKLWEFDKDIKFAKENVVSFECEHLTEVIKGIYQPQKGFDHHKPLLENVTDLKHCFTLLFFHLSPEPLFLEAQDEQGLSRWLMCFEELKKITTPSGSSELIKLNKQISIPPDTHKQRFRYMFLHGGYFLVHEHKNPGVVAYLRSDDQCEYLTIVLAKDAKRRSSESISQDGYDRRQTRAKTRISFASRSYLPLEERSSSVGRILEGQNCPIFGKARWSFGVEFGDKVICFESENVELRDIWIQAFKWLKNHLGSVSQPILVDHVSRLTADLQFEGKNLEQEFKLQKKIGAGGFCEVYLALYGTFPLAVKIFTSHSQDLQTEMDVLKKCRHENLVQFYGSWGPDSQGRLWVTMDYCDAESVHDLVKINGDPARLKLEEQHLAFIIYCTVQGLSYLHQQQRIVHRDIKAANILLSSDGCVRVGDFGISTKLGLKEEKHVFNLCGSPPWMPPEAFKSEITFKNDIWSLGIMAIEMAKGEPPFNKTDTIHQIARKIQMDEPPVLTGEWSSKFKHFVSCCCIKKLEDRYTAEQLLEHEFLSSINYKQAKDEFKEFLRKNREARAKASPVKKILTPQKTKLEGNKPSHLAPPATPRGKSPALGVISEHGNEHSPHLPRAKSSPAATPSPRKGPGFFFSGSSSVVGSGHGEQKHLMNNKPVGGGGGGGGDGGGGGSGDEGNGGDTTNELDDTVRTVHEKTSHTLSDTIAKNELENTFGALDGVGPSETVVLSTD